MRRDLCRLQLDEEKISSGGCSPGPHRSLAAATLRLNAELVEIDQMISTRFRSHRYAEILKSIDGVGELLGTEFLATGGSVKNFASVGHLSDTPTSRPRLAPQEVVPATYTAVSRHWRRRGLAERASTVDSPRAGLRLAGRT